MYSISPQMSMSRDGTYRNKSILQLVELVTIMEQINVRNRCWISLFSHKSLSSMPTTATIVVVSFEAEVWYQKHGIEIEDIGCTDISCDYNFIEVSYVNADIFTPVYSRMEWRGALVYSAAH